MTKKYILAHDTGTGGDKAVLTDLQGRVIHCAYQDYGIYYPQAEWAEQDPEELWRTVAATTRKVIAESGIDPQEILGVGISAQMFNLLPVDEKGTPVTPMLSWLDLRSVPQADRILRGDTPRFLFEKTGNIPTAKDIIPKILWLKEERPELWNRTAQLLDCKEYIIFRLTGQRSPPTGTAPRSISCSTRRKRSGRSRCWIGWASRAKNCRPPTPARM